MPIANTNMYRDIGDGITEITTRKGDCYLIDTSDRCIAERHCWSRHEHGYARAVARTSAGMKTVYLHRLLCPTTKQKPHIDHISRDVSDCRRSNLRACNRSENLQNQKIRSDNTTGYKGVGLHSQSGRYRARITVRGTKIDIGLFVTPEEAAVAVTLLRRKLHKEFARHA